jgi:hypothetical protein
MLPPVAEGLVCPILASCRLSASTARHLTNNPDFCGPRSGCAKEEGQSPQIKSRTYEGNNS